MIFHRLSPLSAMSCKEIKQQLTTDCNASVANGLYWVKGMQECTQSPDVPILVCRYIHAYIIPLIVYKCLECMSMQYCTYSIILRMI